jgi:hypothetical protein
MRALGLFGRPSAAKQEKMRGEETRGDGIGMGCVCAPSFRALVGRLAGSLHLRTLRPSLQARRCICSCDLDACLPCCCLLLPTFNLCCAVVFTQDLLLHRRTPCISLRYADPIPLAIALALEAPPAASVSHAAISGSHSIRQRGKVKPSATCHRPPTPSLFARFPEPGRRCLNLISARRSAPIRPKNFASTLYRQSLQEPAYCSAPATLLTPKRPRGSNLTARLFVGRTHMT